MNIMIGSAPTPECEEAITRVLEGLMWLGCDTIIPVEPLPGHGNAWTPLGYIHKVPFEKPGEQRIRHQVKNLLWWTGDIVWPSFRKPILALRPDTKETVENLEQDLIMLDSCTCHKLGMPPWADGIPLSQLVHPIRVGWGSDEIYTDDSVRLLVDDGVGKLETLCGWPVVSVPADERPWACQIVSHRDRALISESCPRTAGILVDLGYQVQRLDLLSMELLGYGLLDVTLRISA